MVALATALGLLHVTQQGVHFRQGQAAIGTYRTVTGHGAQQLVEVRLNAVAGAIFEQVGQHVADQPRGLGLLEQRRNLPDGQGFRAQALQLEAQLLEPLAVLLGAIRLCLLYTSPSPRDS